MIASQKKQEKNDLSTIWLNLNLLQILDLR
jgi:hypothetical protein